MASQNGHDAVVKALLASGANVNHATTVGRMSCVECVCARCEPVGLRVLECLALLMFMLSLVLSLCWQSIGATALIMASQTGHDAVVRTLLASGARVNQARTVRFAWVMCREGLIGVVVVVAGAVVVVVVVVVVSGIF